MRSALQRVLNATLSVDGDEHAAIGQGLVVLAGIEAGDTEADLLWTARKIAGLRVFEGDDGKMNRSVLEISGAVLLVPNFTLAADCRKGRRPSFDRAMPPDRAEPMFTKLAGLLRDEGVETRTGVFGADMRVALVNDGPVTLVLDSTEGSR